MASFSEVLKQELKRKEGGTKSFLASRPEKLEEEIQRTRAAVEARRGGFFDALAPGLGGSGMERGEALGRESRQLDRSLGSSLDNRRFSSGRSNLQDQYELADLRARRGLEAERGAVDYSRQSLDDILRRRFENEQRIAQEQSSMRKEKTQDTFQYQQNQLADQYASSNSPYEQAMFRSLFGLAGAGTTAYALNRYGKSGNQSSIPGGQLDQFAGTDQFWGNNIVPSRSNSGKFAGTR